MAVDRGCKYVWSAADRRDYLYRRDHGIHERNDVIGTVAVREAEQRLRSTLQGFLAGRGSPSVDGAGSWRTFDRIRPGLEWQWWPMYGTDDPRFASPNRGLLCSPIDRGALPPAYRG
jgi:hypothetical protein